MSLVFDKSYLGQGWDVPFRFSANGGVSMVRYEDKVKLNIITVLATEPGTRFFEPTFGCGLRQYMFAPDDVITQTALKNEIMTALGIWVPIITVTDVQIDIDSKKDNFVPLLVSYVVNATNEEGNLVYPFYKPSEG